MERPKSRFVYDWQCRLHLRRNIGFEDTFTINKLIEFLKICRIEDDLDVLISGTVFAEGLHGDGLDGLGGGLKFRGCRPRHEVRVAIVESAVSIIWRADDVIPEGKSLFKFWFQN